MVSAHNEQTTAAICRDWYRADPRAYIRIAAVLRERISAAELAPGQATPSITRLCADHGVARQTAAHALHVLQDAGLVYRVPGLGYHVCSVSDAGHQAQRFNHQFICRLARHDGRSGDRIEAMRPGVAAYFVQRTPVPRRRCHLVKGMKLHTRIAT